jgi:hypothetical protein
MSRASWFQSSDRRIYGGLVAMDGTGAATFTASKKHAGAFAANGIADVSFTESVRIGGTVNMGDAFGSASFLGGAGTNGAAFDASGTGSFSAADRTLFGESFDASGTGSFGAVAGLATPRSFAMIGQADNVFAGTPIISSSFTMSDSGSAIFAAQLMQKSSATMNGDFSFSVTPKVVNNDPADFTGTESMGFGAAMKYGGAAAMNGTGSAILAGVVQSNAVKPFLFDRDVIRM